MSEHSAVKRFIKVYHGYGHKNDLLIYGHLFDGSPVRRKKYSGNPLVNFWQMMRLFFVRPVAGATLTLRWKNQILEQKTENDGFVKFEWSSVEEVPAGWHPVTLSYSGAVQPIATTGSLFVPHITQYGFISDIDDTIMKSYSAKTLKRLLALLSHHAGEREIFDDVGYHYQLLASSHTTPEAPNPFFYVSSSEWNLYEYLADVFSHHGLPRGAFLLNQVKRWYQLLSSGRTKHGGKLIRIARVLDTFTHQQFVLMGDNSQMDPAIYAEIAQKYPQRIFAVYIRNAYPPHAERSKALLDQLTQLTGVHTCLFNHSREAIAHSKQIGLIERR